MVLPEELREEEGRWQCILFVFLMLWRVCSFLLFLVWLEDITFVHEFEAHGVNSMMLLQAVGLSFHVWSNSRNETYHTLQRQVPLSESQVSPAKLLDTWEKARVATFLQQC